MSKYTQRLGNDTTIEVGYDRQMDYVFVQVIKNGEYLYSNIDDPNINFSLQNDFSHFDVEIRKLGLEIPEDLKVKALNDRADYFKSIESIPNQIFAYYNEDLIGEDDRTFGVEIYQFIDGLHPEVLDYNFFHTESEAIARANQINCSFIDNINDL